MNASNILTTVAQERGFSLEETDDHILELRQHGKVIARFSQMGVEVDNVLKEIQQPGKN